MFRFGKMFCVLCDQWLRKEQARPVINQKEIAVCNTCRENWQRAGGICARCKSPVHVEDDVGIFLDRYALGHLRCGAVPLARARGAHVRTSAA